MPLRFSSTKARSASSQRISLEQFNGADIFNAPRVFRLAQGGEQQRIVCDLESADALSGAHDQPAQWRARSGRHETHSSFAVVLARRRALLLFLAAITIYVLSDDLSLRPRVT
ncbi:MAG: hypothetical protein JOY64_09725 [Alphaproteobacteria bacterium]|nr:hypothetical protein [Alphaproteobacteria bacterium]MBV8407898.1 hypothetical protein [Alphaproteobacteria bacterium]